MFLVHARQYEAEYARWLNLLSLWKHQRRLRSEEPIDVGILDIIFWDFWGSESTFGVQARGANMER